MFRNSFQGGACFIIFSPIDKDLLSNWAIPKCAKKEFDKNAKTYVYSLRTLSISQHLSVPKDRKFSLGLIQPHLVLQVYLPDNQIFSLELRLSCISGSVKRILFSSLQRSYKHSILLSVVPLQIPFKSVWLHLCINMADVVSEIWNERYKSVEFVTINGACSLRLIYTVNENVIGNSAGDWVRKYLNDLPKNCHFPQKVLQKFFLISKENIGQNKETQLVSQRDGNSSLQSVNTRYASPNSTSSFSGSDKSNLSCQTVTKKTGFRVAQGTLATHKNECSSQPSQEVSCCLSDEVMKKEAIFQATEQNVATSCTAN